MKDREKEDAEVRLQGVAPKNRHLIRVANEFLKIHFDPKRPILLAYSGGVDSKALLYTLLECNIRPHLIHVDHGWREESAIEAKQLQEEAKALGCPFFLEKVSLKSVKEEEARLARLEIFAEKGKDYQALLLAHQAEDLAETVLKRIFEGAHLPYLGGMSPVSSEFGIEIWRPFLFLPREELLSFLEERDLKPLFDPSNEDPHYLRAKMSQELFPILSKSFGKEIKHNLCLLSQRSFELRAYLEKKVGFQRETKGPWGVLIDFEGLEALEGYYLLQRTLRKEKLFLSRDQIKTLCSWVYGEKTRKSLKLKEKVIWAHQKKIWIPKDGSQEKELTYSE